MERAMPDTPSEPMEFLSRSWSISSRQLTRALSAPHNHLLLPKTSDDDDIILEELGGDVVVVRGIGRIGNSGCSGNPLSFASSETSQMVTERIMSHSQEVSPRTSGRLSHSSGPLTDSSPVSPSDVVDDSKYSRLANPHTTQFRVYTPGGTSFVAAGAIGGSKTVGRWLKDRREKRKEEMRTQNAEIHAAISVAGLASAVAAIAAATAASSGSGKDEQVARTDLAVASAATLVAAQCIEVAESLGAEREQLASVVGSAVSVRMAGDIATLTASAATALRGVATLKARALKEVWNVAAVIPVERGLGSSHGNNISSNSSNSGEFIPEESFLGIYSRESLARGCELLKLTRKGDLHWKIVSVHINRLNQVILKMKSKHVAGTITKKKKNEVLAVIKDIPAWPGRNLLEGGENRRYFGLKTMLRGVVEFECLNQREYDVWTKGVSRLLELATERSTRHRI